MDVMLNLTNLKQSFCSILVLGRVELKSRVSAVVPIGG